MRTFAAIVFATLSSLSSAKDCKIVKDVTNPLRDVYGRLVLGECESVDRGQSYGRKDFVTGYECNAIVKNIEDLDQALKTAEFGSDAASNNEFLLHFGELRRKWMAQTPALCRHAISPNKSR